MVQIAGNPFSQSTNLNILNELRIQGVLVSPSGGQDIVEVISGDYDQEIDDDTIVIPGPANVQLIQASTAIKEVKIKSKIGGGDVTLIPFLGDTVNAASTLVLGAGVGQTIAPITLDWEVLG